ncbi:hypothetical protein CALCODRAFT_59118 [Calocera cornea HHB12733]|uniref:Uncharacterized protein n=1 Tax=Calocera cornea HHB12733 TaxID=1353952 RepID=A0A165IWR0_9BASI|nr:hypothetical protein CALCODRAFT_59118 [Calocera cornea HHB12733]
MGWPLRHLRHRQRSTVVRLFLACHLCGRGDRGAGMRTGMQKRAATATWLRANVPRVDRAGVGGGSRAEANDWAMSPRPSNRHSEGRGDAGRERRRAVDNGSKAKKEGTTICGSSSLLITDGAQPGRRGGTERSHTAALPLAPLAPHPRPLLPVPPSRPCLARNHVSHRLATPSLP